MRESLVRRMRRRAAQGGPAAHAFIRVATVIGDGVLEPLQTPPPPPPPPPPVPPAPTPLAIMGPPTDPEPGVVYVAVYVGGRWRLEKAVVGKQNSGGAGFRALVVPNAAK